VSKKETLIQDALEQIRAAATMVAPMMAPMSADEVGFIEILLPILLPIFLDWFTKCLKGPAAKKAAQIDDEYRRLTQINSGNRRERKLHKKAEKLFKRDDVIEANGGKKLTEAQEDALYERMVRYTFENRNIVAKAAATR
jgi:hypothetical protein